MQRTLLILTLLAVLIYLGLCAALFAFQRSLIYFPQPRSAGNGATTMALPVEGAQVLVTVRAKSGHQAVVYFGGNAEDVTHSLPSLATAFPEHAIYLMHYRGYGGSTGHPSESALFADSLALFDKVRQQHASVAVIGRSLGSGVAVHLASVRPVTRLVLVTPYDSIQELAARQFPYFPVRWLLRDKFESWKYAAQVQAPTLVIAAEFDEVIPRASTDSLYAHFPAGIASFRVVPRQNHNSISDNPDYLQLLSSPP